MRDLKNYFSNTLGQCFAVSGEGRGEPCIFPFRFEGKQYQNCMIRTNWQNGHDVPICATKVGGNREMKQSGICSRSCRTESKITITSMIFSPYLISKMTGHIPI